MQEADPTNTPPSRRGVLSLAGLLPLATVPSITARAADPDADRELIALSAEFDRLEAAYKATMYNGPAGTAGEKAANAEQDRINEAQRRLATRMARIPATTLAGHAARARSLVGWAPDLMETAGDTETLLRSAILRDLTGIPATMAPEVHHEPPEPATPDPLLAMCAAFRESYHAAQTVSERSTAIRSRLIARWGEPRAGQPVAAVWARDPEYSELCRLVDESDAHSDEATEALDRIMATAAASVAGVIAKLRMALEVQDTPAAEMAYDQRFAVATIEDAVRWLSSIGGEART